MLFFVVALDVQPLNKVYNRNRIPIIGTYNMKGAFLCSALNFME